MWAEVAMAVRRVGQRGTHSYDAAPNLAGAV